MIKKNDNKFCIVGTGGFSKEVLMCLIDIFGINSNKISDLCCFMTHLEDFQESQIMGIEVIHESYFNPEIYEVIVAIGNPSLRKQVVEKLPSNTKFATIIHPTVVISNWVDIGEGTIITAGSIITTNIKIGKHAHINLNTTIGHDCIIGDYFTSSPGTAISGNCQIGECVFFGSNACIKEHINICDNVTIGMGGVVVKNIHQPGIYVGNPVKKLNNL